MWHAVRLRSLEIGLLLGLCLFLPIYEAPKTIFWFAYVLVWLANRLRARDFGGPWDAWDTLIACWIASAFVVAPFAGLHGEEWRGPLDVLRYASVLWVVRRAHYEEREIRWVLGALIVSTVVGVVMGVWAWTYHINFLQLNSVGHVNHTAIYLAIMLALCAAWMLAEHSVLSIGVTAFVLLALYLTASRGALLVGLAAIVLLAATQWARSRAALGLVIALVVLTSATAWMGAAEVARKQKEFTAKHDVLARRDAVWRMGLEAWRHYPWAGVGMDNYKRITFDMVKGWRAERGEGFDPEKFARYGHGHSLYFNTLVERGVIGALPLFAVIAAWLVSLVRRRPRADATSQERLLWGGAAGAWLVTAGVGLVNTTLHHEHGILAVLLLGLWLSKRPGR